MLSSSAYWGIAYSIRRETEQQRWEYLRMEAAMFLASGEHKTYYDDERGCWCFAPRFSRQRQAALSSDPVTAFKQINYADIDYLQVTRAQMQQYLQWCERAGVCPGETFDRGLELRAS